MNARMEIVPHGTVERICAMREAALSRMAECAAALDAAWAVGREASEIARGACMGAGYPGGDPDGNATAALFAPDRWNVDDVLEANRRQLDRRVWTHLLDSTGIRQMMDRQAIDELDASLRNDVQPATYDNVRATLEALFCDADMIFRRGLANAFSSLDRRFRSHDGFRIGSRIILTNVFCEWGGWNYRSNIRDTICDIERVFATLDDRAPDPKGLIQEVEDSRGRGLSPRQSECRSRYFRIKGFKNGNAHLWFNDDALVERANLILAEHYGSVMPDARPAEDDGSDLFGKSTAVARDLQFYRSPEVVVAAVLDDLRLDGASVLEPSAGDGAIAIAAAKGGATVRAIECEADRCAVLASRAVRGGHLIDVREANFLRTAPEPIFDIVVMNPPFYGTHWMDHVRHALDFLKPGGTLRAVLPASARVNETRKHIAFRAWADKYSKQSWRGAFDDLPAGSFAESGTNINTVVLTLKKP